MIVGMPWTLLLTLTLVIMVNNVLSVAMACCFLWSANNVSWIENSMLLDQTQYVHFDASLQPWEA